MQETEEIIYSPPNPDFSKELFMQTVAHEILHTNKYKLGHVSDPLNIMLGSGFGNHLNFNQWKSIHN